MSGWVGLTVYEMNDNSAKSVVLAGVIFAGVMACASEGPLLSGTPAAEASLELDGLVAGKVDPETIVISADGPSTLTVYRPLGRSGQLPAMVVCPGGGYRELCDTYEGVDMAKWLVSRGIVACVLRYRLAPKWHKWLNAFDGWLQDVRRR